jgi:hypothetical protein
MFARTWAACLMRETGARDVVELALFVNALLPKSEKKRVRTFEGYLAGLHAPSLERKGAPGIALIAGQQFPQSLRIATHAIWDVLDISRQIDADSAIKLLQRIDRVASGHYLDLDTGWSRSNPWARLIAPRRKYPNAIELAMDYVACALVMVRVVGPFGASVSRESAIDDLAAAVWLARSSPDLQHLGAELEQYIDRVHLRRVLSPRWQEEGWPFYRGTPCSEALERDVAIARGEEPGRRLLGPVMRSVMGLAQDPFDPKGINITALIQRA